MNTLILVAEVTALLWNVHSWYPQSCCSNIDCISIPESAIEELPEGYRIKETGEVIPYYDYRVKITPFSNDPKKGDPEMGYHWCRRLQDGGNSYTGKTWKKGDTICLFVPGRGT